MANVYWNNKVDSFKKIDVRGVAGNFFAGLKKQAMKLPVGNGLEIIQSFDPLPLYEVMESLGDPDHGIAPGTKFADLPEDFECPLCFVGKDQFAEE